MCGQVSAQDMRRKPATTSKLAPIPAPKVPEKRIANEPTTKAALKTDKEDVIKNIQKVLGLSTKTIKPNRAMVAPAVNDKYTTMDLEQHHDTVLHQAAQHRVNHTEDINQNKLHLTQRANDNWTDWLRTVRLTTGYIN